MIYSNLPGMKICVKCQKEPRAFKTQPYCRACSYAYMKEWRKKNPAKTKEFNRASYVRHHDRRLKEAATYRSEHVQEVRKSRELSRAAKRQLIVDLKTGKPCLDCGGVFPPVAMDFDHVRGVKKFSIAKMGGTTHSVDVLLEEIAKCELVCANCHRIRTQKRKQGWFGGNPNKKGATSGVPQH